MTKQTNDSAATEPTVTAQPDGTPEAVEANAEVEAAAGEPKDEAKADPKAEPGPQPSYSDARELRIQMLERMLAEREATLHTYIRAHKKAEADFDAFRQRMNRDKEREVEAAMGKLVEKLLDVDENLERTVQAAQSGANAIEGVLSGVKLVHKMFLERLGELGLQRIDPIGKEFDPSSMEALGVVPVNEPAKDGKVAITLRAGFRFGSRELRPALVQIGKLMS
ncbi:MAG: nucleotide exchange factor GrpE [Myxococcota bacterium]